MMEGSQFGPVQIFLMGFDKPEFQGEIRQKIQQLHQKGLIRVISIDCFWKDEGGNLKVLEESDLSGEEQKQFGAIIREMVGTGPDTGSKASSGAERLIGAVSGHHFGLSPGDLRRLGDTIPRNSAIAVALIEHIWAIDLQEAVRSEGGRVVAQGFLTPETLVRMGKSFLALRAAAEREEERMFQ